MIVSLSHDTGNEALVEQFRSKIAAYFPDFFAFTITDAEGEPLFDDFDGYVGDVCLNNIHHFVETGEYKVQIHPNPYAYHFDVIGHWEGQVQKGIILISFRPELLARIINLAQPHGHELILVSNDETRLIEVTTVGSRNKMPAREDYRLPSNIKQRILYSQPVRGSTWNLIDIYKQDNQANFEYHLFRQMALIFLIFSMGVIAMWWFVRREEKKRESAEKKLLISHGNILKLNKEIGSKNAVLEEKQKILDEESQLARRVFNKVASICTTNSGFVDSYLSPMSTFNGDLLISNRSGSGKSYVMLCDFTGHGLPAALGAIPVSDIFHELTSRDASVKDIATSINEKIYSLLPTDRFCCAVIIEFDKGTNVVNVWNSGLPDVLLLDANNSIKERVGSCYLPLGITSAIDANTHNKSNTVTKGDYMCIYTDGIIEAENSDGTMFGEERLEECFLPSIKPDNILDHVISRLSEFCKDAPQSDDVSIAKVNFSSAE